MSKVDRGLPLYMPGCSHWDAAFPYTVAMTRVACLQMVSHDSLDDNLEAAARLVREAVAAGAEFALLPEYFPIMSDDENAKVRLREEPGKGPIQDFLGDQARSHGLWLMGGTLPMACGDPMRVFNTSLLYDPTGAVVARYDKIHLFDVNVDSEGRESYCESATIRPGNEIVVATTPFARIGMSVCYDLRFPELYRQLVDQNASVITVPSAFTYTTGKRHWETLLKARAVENLCYVIATNQGGQNTPKRATWGHSMIIGPWGDILACRDEEGPGIAVADLDFTRQENLRRSFPALQHRTLQQDQQYS